jgi:hypothetical protein
LPPARLLTACLPTGIRQNKNSRRLFFRGPESPEMSAYVDIIELVFR